MLVGHETREDAIVSALATPYAPRRPTESVLYGMVRQHLESFLRWARETYEKPLPRYVEDELRGYLRCGVFAHGFVRCRCDQCGHGIIVAFSCKARGICPSCAGRRMGNVAAHLVDRVLPDVPVRQYVLSLPHELRALAAFRADVLTVIARVFVESIFASYRATARGLGVDTAECGAVTFVQRFGGSLNLNVHLHVLVLDGVYSRDREGRAVFHALPPPTDASLAKILVRVDQRIAAWLRRRGFAGDGERGDGASDTPAESALDACAGIAMQPGTRVTTASGRDVMASEDETALHTHRPSIAVERSGFNLHAAVRIAAGDDRGRERLCRYGSRPALSLARLQRWPGGRVAYRIKYVGRGRAKHRVMTGIELCARLAALIPPPRYPLVRYHGVLAPRSSWRKEVVPRPRIAVTEGRCGRSRSERPAAASPAKAKPPKAKPLRSSCSMRPHDVVTRRTVKTETETETQTETCIEPARSVTAVTTHMLAPNVVSTTHWDRLLGGALYAATVRMDWATLLRRTFAVDVLECRVCAGRLRVLGAVLDRAYARALLERLGLPTDSPPVASARDPTDDDDEYGAPTDDDDVQ